MDDRGDRGDRGDDIGVSDDLLSDVDLSLDLLADVGDDVLALLPEGGLRDDLCLSGALLLGCTLLLGGALLHLGALLLGGALLLRHHVRDVLALLLSGALGLVVTDLLGHSVANLLRNLFDDVRALLLHSGFTLFL